MVVIDLHSRSTSFKFFFVFFLITVVSVEKKNKFKPVCGNLHANPNDYL